MEPRRLTRVLAVVATALAGLLVASATPLSDDVAVAIDTARVVVRPDRAARATEPVRYGDTALTLLASYAVVDGALVGPVREVGDDAALWALVPATLPADAVASVRQLNVASDGRHGTLAMVHRSSVDPTTWVLTLDPAEATDVLVETLIHEYAHMLTMGPDDVTGRRSAGIGCDGVTIELGCARPGSLLARWHDAFWADTAEPARYDPTAFVSEYAATSVHEDVAETFLAWVLGEVTDPTGALAERFAFLDGEPDLVHARQQLAAHRQSSRVSG